MSYSNDHDPRRLNGPDLSNSDAARPHPSPRDEAGHAPCERSEAHAPRQHASRPKGAHVPREPSEAHVKHALLAEYVVLEEESEENFDEFASEFHDFLKPANPVARMLVDDLVAANWRRMRIRGIEAEIFNVAVDDCKPVAFDERNAMAQAFRNLSGKSGMLNLLNRYETRFDRQIHRSLKLFKEWNQPDNSNCQTNPSEPLAPAPPAEPPQSEPIPETAAANTDSLAKRTQAPTPPADPPQAEPIPETAPANTDTLAKRTQAPTPPAEPPQSEPIPETAPASIDSLAKRTQAAGPIRSSHLARRSQTNTDPLPGAEEAKMPGVRPLHGRTGSRRAPNIVAGSIEGSVSLVTMLPKDPRPKLRERIVASGRGHSQSCQARTVNRRETQIAAHLHSSDGPPGEIIKRQNSDRPDCEGTSRQSTPQGWFRSSRRGIGRQGRLRDGWAVKSVQAETLPTTVSKLLPKLGCEDCLVQRERNIPMNSRSAQRRQHHIQKQVAQADHKRPKQKPEEAMQAGAREYPAPPFPKQHQAKPGLEANLDPAPMYDAPFYRGSGKLQDKVALITGGDSGIGRAVAILFAREGANIAITYLNQEQPDAEATKKGVEAEGRKCILIAGDVSSQKFCERAVTRTVKEFGSIDILVNNAAFQVHTSRFEDLTAGHFDETLQTNLYGYFYMAQAAVQQMKSGSAIVNTGSVTGLLGNAELLDYSMTKGGIHAFTRSLATHLVPRGIRVNAVAPGPVWTPLNPSDKEAKDVSQFGSKTPMKRPAQPEEIAPAYVFLASPQCSSYITGEILPIIGGYNGG